MGHLVIGITGLRGLNVNLQVLRLMNRAYRGHDPTGQFGFLPFSFFLCSSISLVTKLLQSQVSGDIAKAAILNEAIYQNRKTSFSEHSRPIFLVFLQIYQQYKLSSANVLAVTLCLVYGASVLVGL